MHDSSTEPSSLAGVNQQIILLMSRYRRCSRIYWRHTNKVPSSWDGTAYQMFKVCCPCCERSAGCLNVFFTPGNRIGRRWLTPPQPVTATCRVTMTVNLRLATAETLAQGRQSYGFACSTVFKFLSTPSWFLRLRYFSRTRS